MSGRLGHGTLSCSTPFTVKYSDHFHAHAIVTKMEYLEILVINGDVHFHVQLYSTVKYSDHFHAHAIVTKMEYLTISHTQLLSHIPLHIRSVTGFTGPGEKAVILKHHISTP